MTGGQAVGSGAMTPPRAFTVLPRVHVVRPLPRDPAPPVTGTLLDPRFSRALDYKLRRLKEKQQVPAPASTVEGEERPRFVTTVKCGRFLPPPPGVAKLLGLESLYEEQDRLYSYSSRPAAVTSRPKRAVSKPPQPPQPPRVHPARGVAALIAATAGFRQVFANGNLPNGATVHDKRIVRGSTFASHPLAAGDGLESAAARAARTRRRALQRRAAAARLRPGTPPPAPGRKHHPIQTEYYLEELFAKGVEMEVGVQTDLFVDRPPTPIYVPAKTGADAATQIYPGDLFDFDLEVQHILEVLVGKCSEQALAEVAQEEELETLREQQRRFRELRDAERAERERLAKQELRLHDEKERRVQEARAAAEAAVGARTRAAAAVLVQGHCASLLPAVLAGLRDQGYLVERLQRGVDDEFLPWLLHAVTSEVEAVLRSRDLLTELVREVVAARADLYRAAAEAREARPDTEESITPPSMMGEGEEELEQDKEDE